MKLEMKMEKLEKKTMMNLEITMQKLKAKVMNSVMKIVMRKTKGIALDKSEKQLQMVNLVCVSY